MAGGTRAATLVAIALGGAAGAVVHVTGRSTRAAASALGRPETVEQTAEEIVEAGGVAHAHRVDPSSPDQAAALVAEIAARHGGRLDVLVNGIWGGDPHTDWEHPFWEQDVDTGLALLRQAVHTHIITGAAAVPLMVARAHRLALCIDGRGLAAPGAPACPFRRA